jgi:very-short-patch-repair endonuclease
MAIELDLQRLAARQHGLASRTQLLALGFTRRQIDVRIANGRWRFAAPSVLDVAPAGFDPRRALHAAVLASGAVASHRSAAALHRLVDDPPPRPQLLVATTAVPRGLDAEVRRTIVLPRGDTGVVDAIACTSVTRTLLDLGSVVDAGLLATAVNRAFLERRTTPIRLARRIDEQLCGRRGVAPLRRVLEPYLVDEVRCESDLEALLLLAIVDGRLPPARWQYWVRAQGRRYRLDCAWPAQRVFIEADGMREHTMRATFENDRRRQNALVRAGWAPIRCSWTDVRRRPGRLISETAAILAARS